MFVLLCCVLVIKQNEQLRGGLWQASVSSVVVASDNVARVRIPATQSAIPACLSNSGWPLLHYSTP